VLNTLHTLKDPLNANLQVMGGDILYELGLNAYDPGNYNRLIFTTFAFPDEWNMKGKQPSFLTSYRLLFAGWPLNKVYGYSRPDSDTILSYDALSVFLEGSNQAYQKKQDFTSADLQEALRNIKGTGAFQGLSGRISFDDSYSQKAVIILYAKEGYTQPGPVYGCLDMADKNDLQCKFS
jgi:ABC-type branched-subunit amino acid transport system substrate-binding protein